MHSSIISNCQNSKTTQISINSRKQWYRTSLVAQWLRIHLPMQGTRVRALVREDPTGPGATKPMRHNYWSPRALSPWLHNNRSHHNERPEHRNEEKPPLATTRESLAQQRRPDTDQKKKKRKKERKQWYICIHTEYYTAMIYNYIQQPGWITQTACKQKRPDTRVYILHGSTYIRQETSKTHLCCCESE